MYYPALLIVTNYQPLQLKEGMMFKTVLYPNTEKEFIELWKTTKFHSNWGSATAINNFYAIHGYPVELMIVDTDGQTIAEHDQIGWWDEGEQTEDLRDIELKDINKILKDDGQIEIEISNEAYQITQVVPITAEGKVILRYPIQEYGEEFDDLPSNEFNEEEE